MKSKQRKLELTIGEEAGLKRALEGGGFIIKVPSSSFRLATIEKTDGLGGFDTMMTLNPELTVKLQNYYRQCFKKDYYLIGLKSFIDIHCKR